MRSLRKTLEALGDTSAEVAAKLRTAGVKGRRMRPCSCPVAAYLKLQGYVDPRVLGGEATTKRAMTRTTHAVASFVWDFDGGRYPDLEAT